MVLCLCLEGAWAVLYVVWDCQAALVCLRTEMAHRIGLSFGRTVGFHGGGSAERSLWLRQVQTICLCNEV